MKHRKNMKKDQEAGLRCSSSIHGSILVLWEHIKSKLPTPGMRRAAGWTFHTSVSPHTTNRSTEPVRLSHPEYPEMWVKLKNATADRSGGWKQTELHSSDGEAVKSRPVRGTAPQSGAFSFIEHIQFHCSLHPKLGETNFCSTETLQDLQECFPQH